MPVYTHQVPEDVVQWLGVRLRDERRRRAWTLKDMASRTSVSVATLSAIENQKASPDVGLLVQLSSALSLPLDALLPHSRVAHFCLTRRVAIDAHPPTPMKLVSRRRRTATPYHNRLWALAEAFVGKYIEPFEIEIQSARDDELRFISHNHQEFFFVLHGRLETLIKSPEGLLRETLGPGDCMYFRSDLPHCIRSTTAKPARSVHVLYSLHETADSESADGITGPMIYLMEAQQRNVVEQIADKIVSLRQARGMSAAEFAGTIGMSVRRLAKIEKGHRPISLKLLLHICRTFRKPAEFFLASTCVNGPAFNVVRAADLRRSAAKPARSPRAGTRCFARATFKSLADGFANRGMHPYLVTLDGTRGDRANRLLPHGGQEFVYVLRGAINLVTKRDDEPVAETLFPGDSCFIDASVPHRFIEARFNPYDTAGAEAIVVSWHPAETDA